MKKLTSDLDLGLEDVTAVVNCLVYDGLIEKEPPTISTRMRSRDLYRRARKPLILGSKITDIPCATCPVFTKCSDTGDINPTTCTYLQNWLDHF